VKVSRSQSVCYPAIYCIFMWPEGGKGQAYVDWPCPLMGYVRACCAAKFRSKYLCEGCKIRENALKVRAVL